MTEVEKKRKFIINTAYYALVLFLCYIVLKYAMGTLFPIFCAFIIAALLQKPKKFLTKKTFLKDGAASAICVFVGIFIIGFVIFVIGAKIASEVKGFIDYIMIQLQNIDVLVNNIENTVMNLVSHLPDSLGKTLQENVTLLFVQIREWLAGSNAELPEQIVGSISGAFSLDWITTPLSGVISTASKIPSVLIAVIITLVCSCFMTADFDKIKTFFTNQLPEEKRRNFLRSKTLMKNTVTKMAKAYLLIMAVTFAEMTVGLSVLKIFGIYSSGYIFVIALATAIVDIIPVLGTGTILIPWALYNLITGNFAMAIGLGVIYAVITVIRQIIEPKLVAGQLGLPPFLTISAMYIGLKFLGVLGMLIAPLLVTMLKLLNDEGILKLWKSSKQVEEAAKQAETVSVPAETEETANGDSEEK